MRKNNCSRFINKLNQLMVGFIITRLTNYNTSHAYI